MDDVEHEQRHLALAEGVGGAETRERAGDHAVSPALEDDAEVVPGAGPVLVQPPLCDEAPGRRQAVLDLGLLLVVGGGRQDDPPVVEFGLQRRALPAARRRAVVLADEAAGHVAGADAQRQHDRQVGGLGELEGLLRELDHRRHLGARVDQRDRGLQGRRVGAFLNHAGALAVVLAHDDHGAALDPRRGEVRQRVRGDVGADDRFPGDGAAEGIVDRGAEQRRRAGLRGRLLEMDAVGLEHPLAGVGEDVEEVGDRRPRIAADIGDPGLQQRLGDAQDRLAVKARAGAQQQLVDIAREGPLAPAGGGDGGRDRGGVGRSGGCGSGGVGGHRARPTAPRAGSAFPVMPCSPPVPAPEPRRPQYRRARRNSRTPTTSPTLRAAGFGTNRLIERGPGGSIHPSRGTNEARGRCAGRPPFAG